jgi:hypothetical protein
MKEKSARPMAVVAAMVALRSDAAVEASARARDSTDWRV